MLHSKYAPQTWADVAGLDREIGTIRRIIEAPGFQGGAFLLSGPSGIGKTTLARIMAASLVSEPCMVRQMEGDRCTVNTVHEWADGLRSSIFGWQGVIINECHAITPKAVAAWLNLLDQWPKRVLAVFTTTEVPAFEGPQRQTEAMLSRCIEIGLNIGLDERALAFAARVKSVAEAEGLGGAKLADYAQLVKDLAFNMRRCLNEVHKGTMYRPLAEMRVA